MMANNTTQNSTSEAFYEEMHPAFIAFQCIFFVVVGFFGVLGNSIALGALATTPKLRNSCTALIGNLSVTDLIISLYLLFVLTPTLLKKGFPDNIVLCRTMLRLPHVNYSVSLTTLVFIAVNRYLLITRSRPVYDLCCGTKQVVLHIALTWVLAFFTAILPAVTGTNPGVYDREVWGCIANTNWLFTTITLLFYVLVPAFVLVPLLYGLTICAVKASHKRVHAHESGSSADPPQPAPGPEGSAVSSIASSVNNPGDARRNPRHITKQEINLTRIPILIFAVFAICWTPNLISHVTGRFFKVSVYYHKISSLFIFSNSTINPYLYAWSNRNFRQAYKRLLAKMRSKFRRGT